MFETKTPAKTVAQITSSLNALKNPDKTIAHIDLTLDALKNPTETKPPAKFEIKTSMFETKPPAKTFA